MDALYLFLAIWIKVGIEERKGSTVIIKLNHQSLNTQNDTYSILNNPG
jgi:hypothetical protein